MGEDLKSDKKLVKIVLIFFYFLFVFNKFLDWIIGFVDLFIAFCLLKEV